VYGSLDWDLPTVGFHDYTGQRGAFITHIIIQNSKALQGKVFIVFLQFSLPIHVFPNALILSFSIRGCYNEQYTT
jgi:hypothetical protein